MSEEPAIDPATGSSLANEGMNGRSLDGRDTLARDIVMLRARCSNLRHWCRTLLDNPAAAGVLPEATAAELRSTTPELTEAEGQTVVALLARGGNVPPTHPLAPETMQTPVLQMTGKQLTDEHERLRTAFFALHDHLHPGDDLTDEFFLEQRQQGPSTTIADIITEFERELRSNP